MKKRRSYGEKLSTLMLNLIDRKDDDPKIHQSFEPADKPFKDVNQIRRKIDRGEIKTKPNHWEPIDPQQKMLEDLSTVAAY